MKLKDYQREFGDDDRLQIKQEKVDDFMSYEEQKKLSDLYIKMLPKDYKDMVKN